ncbi:unnamed protein product [Lactuca saligna]|uniref:Uncharacterized protein n=1 Tax=Lactuca saligna TaxID=75948 RepID=A0AA35Z870_LACSI|nr:unnamed protein product [Lactuca saligna]
MSTLNVDAAGGLGSNTKSPKADHASKPSSSGANTEYDSHIMLLNLPQAELCLLCSMLAHECLSDNAYALVAEGTVLDTAKSLIFPLPLVAAAHQQFLAGCRHADANGLDGLKMKHSYLSRATIHGNHMTRKRVLINAFTVRDTFPPARGAGIMALCATSSYYEPQEIAARILPNVVVPTIDPDSDVRSKAFQAVEQFLQIVKQYHEKTSGGDSSEGMGSTISSLPGNASILGWAMNSLTTKGKPSEQTTQAMPPKSTSPLVSVVPTTVVSRTHTQSTTTLVRCGSSDYGGDMADQPAPVSPTSTEEWGEPENSIGIHEDEEIEKDGWDDMLPLEDEKLPPALANIEAAQKRLVIHTKPQAAGGSGSGSVVDEDDPWTTIATPASAKGYSYKTSLIVGVADVVQKESLHFCLGVETVQVFVGPVSYLLLSKRVTDSNSSSIPYPAKTLRLLNTR